MSTNEQPEIVIQDVLNLLKSGYTRLKKDDLGYGSIQEHYNLSVAEVKDLFREPKLHMKKTALPKRTLRIVDRDMPGTAGQSFSITLNVEEASLQDVVDETAGAAVPTVTAASKEELFK